MPRASKRARPIPPNFKKGISDVTNKAKRKAIGLLDRCLEPHCLSSSEHHGLVLEVSKTLDLLASSSDDDSDAEENVNHDMKKTSKLKPRNKGNRPDDHNEVCEVCEKGGDLLCCDTCTLVFHLGCIRPKLNSVPKGKWSCAHCVADGLGQGDGKAAKTALLKMNRLSRGMDSEDEEDGSGARISRIGEITVVRSGKRLIVRRTAHSQILELGRYDNLEEALGTLKGFYSRVALLSAPSVDDLTDKSKSRRNVTNTVVSSIDDDGLWCMYCMDDASIQLCAFCGCRTCFGKHDSEYLLVCDHCDQESHTYCLSPQLTQVPADAWFCPACTAAGIKAQPAPVEDDDQVEKSIDTGQESNDGDHYNDDHDYEDADEAAAAGIRVRKKMGGKKSIATIEVSLVSSAKANSEEVAVHRGPGRPSGGGGHPHLHRPVGRPPSAGSHRPVGRPPMGGRGGGGSGRSSGRGPGRPSGRGHHTHTSAFATASKGAGSGSHGGGGESTTGNSSSDDRDRDESHAYAEASSASRVSRGRGRPPGSGRRSKETLDAAAEAATDGAEDGVTKECEVVKPEPAGVSVETALAMVARMAGNRPFHPAEKSLLSQLRDWAPLQDLETVHDALVQQKEALVQRLLAIDPSFSVDQLKVYPEEQVAYTLTELVGAAEEAHIHAAKKAGGGPRRPTSSKKGSSKSSGAAASHGHTTTPAGETKVPVSGTAKKSRAKKAAKAEAAVIKAEAAAAKAEAAKIKAAATLNLSAAAVEAPSAELGSLSPRLIAGSSGSGPGSLLVPSLGSFDLVDYDVGLDLFLPGENSFRESLSRDGGAGNDTDRSLRPTAAERVGDVDKVAGLDTLGANTGAMGPD